MAAVTDLKESDLQLPQGRVTDHRINLTLYKLDGWWGDLDALVQPLRTEHQADWAALGASSDYCRGLLARTGLPQRNLKCCCYRWAGTVAGCLPTVTHRSPSMRGVVEWVSDAKPLAYILGEREFGSCRYG